MFFPFLECPSFPSFPTEILLLPGQILITPQTSLRVCLPQLVFAANASSQRALTLLKSFRTQLLLEQIPVLCFTHTGYCSKLFTFINSLNHHHDPRSSVPVSPQFLLEEKGVAWAGPHGSQPVAETGFQPRDGRGHVLSHNTAFLMCMSPSQKELPACCYFHPPPRTQP